MQLAGAGGSVAVTSPTTSKEPRQISNSSNSGGRGGVRGEPTSAAEREEMLNQAEWEFRRWLIESSAGSGRYVMFPSTRQILESLKALYSTLEEIDFTGIAL
ncbi:hypothetical protein H4R26_005613 [Coemansia thaxteri]|uniref:Uncharacterized protein n=1 Tax=Coemansia thaxteri TaxID=2663907 RepID=A0A9W8EGF8_9FUNG|nr:hypothetical protein H4R26_005613 [Coemansia thaxteri]